MTRHLACFVAALLALASTDSSARTAPPLAAPNVEILVNGVPQTRYAHEGRWYVEALKGREYAIRLRNPYPVRVAVALSVDGLNTIDARETRAKGARKWVLGPYETVTISGWQTSASHDRRTTSSRSRSASRPSSPQEGCPQHRYQATSWRAASASWVTASSG